MRLLRCFECKTIEQLPDLAPGLDPTTAYDPLLEELVGRHKAPDGRPHTGQLYSIEDKHWRDEHARKQILEKMGVKTTGLPGEFYAVKDTYTEDANKCFNAHKRPEGFCIDWCADSKKLGRATPEGRAWQKMNEKAPQPYLCHFCPVASTVMTAQRAARGDYRK